MIRNSLNSVHFSGQQAHSLRRPVPQCRLFALPLRRPFAVPGASFSRCFSKASSGGSVPVITKPELKALIKSDEKYVLIDVREYEETQQTGLIPTAKKYTRWSCVSGFNRKW